MASRILNNELNTNFRSYNRVGIFNGQRSARGSAMSVNVCMHRPYTSIRSMCVCDKCHCLIIDDEVKEKYYLTNNNKLGKIQFKTYFYIILLNILSRREIMFNFHIKLILFNLYFIFREEKIILNLEKL